MYSDICVYICVYTQTHTHSQITAILRSHNDKNILEA